MWKLKKLNHHVTSYTKQINDLAKEFKLISTKLLDLINKYSILNVGKDFHYMDCKII